MKTLLALIFLSLLASLTGGAAPAPINPAQVALLYNSQIPESKALAETYANQRHIPERNLIGLPLPAEPDLTRAQFNSLLLNPLRKHFTDQKWWTLTKGRGGITVPETNSIRYLVTFKGVPLRIKRYDMKPGEEKAGQFAKNNEAAVDNELMLMGIHGHQIPGPLPNPYFQKDYPFASSQLTPYLLVGRIDAPTYPLCTRLILDALDTEEKGLWGRAYLDLARKGEGYKLGDDWLENIARRNLKEGIPTVIDTHKDTFVSHYPMNDAALYFGWYAHHRNGPLLNSRFQFKKGAIAVHLHSFSAQQLTNANRNWSASLLAHGAAATLGNVHEPYLQLTHHFDLFHARLLDGYPLVEAAAMALPFLSWQNIVIGDPLYRPYAQLSKIDKSQTANRDYHTLRAAALSWPDPAERLPKIAEAAQKLNSPTLLEATALLLTAGGDLPNAEKFYLAAQSAYPAPADQLRQLLHRIDLKRRQAQTPAALALISEGDRKFAAIPEAAALKSLRVILDPPPPPPAQAKPKPKNKVQ
ncbi:MAG: TIGR03790 family protein [Verrucomicrobiales bacterium]